MNRGRLRHTARVAAILAALGAAMLAPVASAEAGEAGQASQERVIRRLGGSTRFSPPVRSADALRQMATKNRTDLEAVLQMAGLSSVSGQVMDALTSGNVTPSTFAPGDHLEWMALRRAGKPELLRNARWGGAKPFPGFRFTVDTPTMVYSFIVPEDCGNLSLVSATAKPQVTTPKPPQPPEPKPPTPKPPQPPEQKPPQPPEPKPPTPKPTEPLPPVVVDKLDPFIVGAFGKQRRTLEEEIVAGATQIGSYCDVLLGVRGGIQYMATPKFMIAPAVGLAINLDEGERTAFLAEVEFNRVLDNGGLFGVGIGVWDMFDGDNIAPSLLLHGGIPIARYTDKTARALFVIEGRLFLNELDSVDNNYQFWAGVRYVFR